MEQKKAKFNLQAIDMKFFEDDYDISLKEPENDLKEVASEYLQLNYPIHLYKEIVDEDEYWVACHPDLPGCKADGETETEAILNLKDARVSWIYTALDNNLNVPIPNQQDHIEEYSGKILLRLPKSLHYQVSLEAKRDNVSINQELVTLISKSIGRKEDSISYGLLEQKLNLLSKQVESLTEIISEKHNVFVIQENKFSKNKKLTLDFYEGLNNIINSKFSIHEIDISESRVKKEKLKMSPLSFDNIYGEYNEHYN